MGFNATASSEAGRIDEITAILQQNFNIGLEMLVPLIVLLVLAIRKMPAFPAISIGAVLGAVWAVLFQSDLIASQIDISQGQLIGYFKLIWTTFLMVLVLVPKTTIWMRSSVVAVCQVCLQQPG